MPKLVNRPPKYRFHKSTGQAVVSINGRAVQLGPFGSERSHQKYQELLGQWRELRREQRPDGVDDSEGGDLASLPNLQLRSRRGYPVTLNELALAYREHAQAYYRKNGKPTREAELVVEVLRVLLKEHGELAIEEFGPVALKHVRQRMIDELDWSRKFINKQVNRLVLMFSWAVENELTTPTVHQALRTVKGLKKGRTEARETKRVTVVEDDVVDATLPFMPEIIADMVRFQRLTGARPGEVCSIRPCDIDRSGDIWVYQPDSHKTEHFDTDRLIMIGPKGQALLKPYLSRTDESFCFSPTESIERKRQRQRGARLTPLNAGNSTGSNRKKNPKRTASDRYKNSSYRLAVNRACKKANVETWSPNRLRHTAATEIRKKFGLEAAQVVCGHQSADVTQIYAERDIALAESVAREVG